MGEIYCDERKIYDEFNVATLRTLGRKRYTALRKKYFPRPAKSPNS